MSKTWQDSFEAWAKLRIPNADNPLVLDARFNYQPEKGVILKFLTEKGLPHTLSNLSLNITGVGSLFIPEATFKSQSIGLNQEFCFTTRAFLLLHGELDSPLGSVNYVSSFFPEGYVFLGHDPFKLNWPNEDEYIIHAKKILLDLDLGGSGERLTFETGIQAHKDGTVLRHQLIPISSFSLEYEREAEWPVRIEDLNRLRAMLDFLSFKPHRWSISHLRDAAGRRMTHISQRYNIQLPVSTRMTGFLAVPLREAQDDFEPLMRFGLMDSWKLSSFGEIVGLIRYPSRSFEDRLFTAIRALEVRTHEKDQDLLNKKLVAKLATFETEWRLLGISDSARFRWLLRNTRNHLAHLTTLSETDPPFNENDSYRAYIQSVAACRASLFRAGGMSANRIEKYLARVRDKCQASYGAMDFSHYPDTPSWVV